MVLSLGAWGNNKLHQTTQPLRLRPVWWLRRSSWLLALDTALRRFVCSHGCRSLCPGGILRIDRAPQEGPGEPLDQTKPFRVSVGRLRDVVAGNATQGMLGSIECQKRFGTWAQGVSIGAPVVTVREVGMMVLVP